MVRHGCDLQLTQVLAVGPGYGRETATDSETWELQDLPEGFVFCAMMSVDQDYVHTMTVYVNGEYIQAVRYRNTATMKLPVPAGGTLRIEVLCDAVGLYAIGWGHSELDTTPEHWNTPVPVVQSVECTPMSAWTPISKSWSMYNRNDAPPPEQYDPTLIQPTTPAGRDENYQRAASFQGTKQPVDQYHDYYPEPQNVRIPLAYGNPTTGAPGGIQFGNPAFDGYGGMGWVGYKVMDAPVYAGVVNNSQVWQAGEVFRLPEVSDVLRPIPNTQSGTHLEQAWGTLASGSTEVQFRGIKVSVTKMNSSTNRPGYVQWRIMEPGAFTKELIDTPYVPADYESYFEHTYPKGQLNKWGPTHIGFQTGIGFPVHSTSMISPGGIPVNFYGDSNGEPGQNWQPYGVFPFYSHYTSFNDGDVAHRPTTLAEQVQFEFSNPDSFAALDLSEPGKRKRYLGLSASHSPLHTMPEVWDNFENYDAPHGYNVTWFKGISMTQEYLLPPTIEYRGFPLFGSLKVMTEDGWKTAGIYQEFATEGATLGVLKLNLPAGTWVKSFWQGFLWGQGWGTPLNVKTAGGWETAALMIEDDSP